MKRNNRNSWRLSAHIIRSVNSHLEWLQTSICNLL